MRNKELLSWQWNRDLIYFMIANNIKKKTPQVIHTVHTHTLSTVILAFIVSNPSTHVFELHSHGNTDFIITMYRKVHDGFNVQCFCLSQREKQLKASATVKHLGEGVLA